MSLSGLALCLCACLAVAWGGYTTRFDNVDVNQITNNPRLLKAYVDCLLDRGRCTPDGEELKRTIPDALASRCAKCSARQRAGADHVLRFLITRRPDLYAPLEQRYDPTQYYSRTYRAEAARRGAPV